MSDRPVLLDLFCGAGGSAVGYARAGFEVTGIDNVFQPRYPFVFVQADALEYVTAHGHEYDAIHASPPCQLHSAAKRIGNGRPGHRDCIRETRRLLNESGRPWVIENVPGAPLLLPMTLCGTQFGLRLRRHRLFESSVFLFGRSEPCNHRDGDYTVFGHAAQLCGSRGAAYKDASGRTHWRPIRRPLLEGCEAMGIDWMTRAEISQAIPPAYTKFIGGQLIRVMEAAKST